MMVKQTIPPRDIEQLCAYLDDQLPPAQRSRLEIRLRSEPGLQVELDGLRRTRLMLRSLPRRRAPRNFTLTPAMVGASRPRPWQTVFGMASAVAAALLVLVLLSDFLFVPGYVGMFPVSQAPAQVENPALAQKSAKEVGPAPEEALIFPTEAPTPTLQPPSEKPLPASLPTATPQAAAEVGVMADSLTSPSPEDRAMLEAAPAAVAGTPPAEGLLAQSPAITNSLSLTDTLTVTPTLTIQESPGGALAEKSAPAQAAGEVGLVSPGEAEQQPEQLWMQVIFWMVELLLACLAVASGLLSFYLWYTSRR